MTLRSSTMETSNTQRLLAWHSSWVLMTTTSATTRERGTVGILTPCDHAIGTGRLTTIEFEAIMTTPAA